MIDQMAIEIIDRSNRINSQDLLLSGWHRICTRDGQFWVHPELSDNGVRFHIAVRIEKAFRDLCENVKTRQGDGE